MRAKKLTLSRYQRFVLIRGLLRGLLSDYTGQPPKKIHLTYTQSGKPNLLALPFEKKLEFNLSHSKNRIAFAFTLDTPIGIDLEYKQPRKFLDKIAYRFFSSDDYKRIKVLTGTKKLDAFFSTWVHNEALIKASGNSLKTHTFSQYNINLDKELILDKEKLAYSLLSLTLHADFSAALAIKGKAKTVIINSVVPEKSNL